MNKLRIVLSFLLLFCLLPSLLTAQEGRGRGRGGGRGRDRNIYETTFVETEGRGLLIRSNPSGARVFIDGLDRGYTPVELPYLQAGQYHIRLNRDGFREENFYITLFSNSRLVVSVRMYEERGYANLSFHKAEGIPDTFPFNPQIFIRALGEDWYPVYLPDTNTMLLNLPVGFHTIRARAFGWENTSATVTVNEHITTAANIYMRPAVFRLENGSQSRKSFNPKNSGALGIVNYRFEVSAPGTGTLTILDENDLAVYEKHLDPFSTWDQFVTWDGTDFYGNTVPEGTYTAVIEASGLPGVSYEPLKVLAVKMETKIDYSMEIFPLSLSGGIPGLVFTPLPHTLPAGSFQIEGGILFGSFHAPEQFLNEQNNPVYGLPFEIGFRVSPLNRLEIAAAFNVNPYFDNPAGCGFTGSTKLNILRGAGAVPIRLSAGASYTWAGKNGEAPLSSGRGAGFYVPLSLEPANFSVVFSPGLFWHGPDSPLPALLLSTGLLYRGGWMNAGLSLRPEINFNNSENRIRLLAGAEGRFYPPPSNLVFTFKAGVWTHNARTGGYGGVGIGVIY